LPEGLKQEFWTELKAYEEENQVSYITTGEEIGFKRGLAQGVEQGVEQGEQKLVILLLEQRLGKISAELKEQIDGLSLAQVEALAIALFHITSIVELETWLSHQSGISN
jgi:flagellar biosynthesis/type III secretory pathway protein FliH